MYVGKIKSFYPQPNNALKVESTLCVGLAQHNLSLRQYIYMCVCVCVRSEERRVGKECVP